MNPKDNYLNKLIGGVQSIPVPKVKQPSYDFSQVKGGQMSPYTPANSGATNPTVPTSPVASSTPSPARTQFTQSLAQSNQPITGSVQTPSGAIVNTQTGGLEQAPPVDPNQKYRDAFDSYLSSLRPSDAETQATQNLNNLTLQSKKDYEKALESGETLGFASGEAARVNRNNSFGIEAAGNALSALTGQRQAMNEGLKARVDFEKNILPKPQSVSDQYGTGSIGEYNFAKSQGYKGSFTDYQNEDANRKKAIAKAGAITYGTGTPGTLSPLAQAVQNGTISIDKIPMAERAGIAAELATSGIPSSLQQTREANLDVVDALLENPNKNVISGYIQGKLGLGSIAPSGQLALNQFDQLKGILSLANREQLKGTGAISDFEFKVLSQAATALGRNLNDAQFNEQLQNIRDVFAGKYRLTKATQASDVVEQNQGGANNPLGI